MKTRLLIAGLVVFAAAAAGAYWWSREPELLRRYDRITGKMTLDQVRDAMGFDEDPPDPRKTTTGEFERSWSFSDGGRITVAFTPDGYCFYKEIGPQYCRVTPLSGKYVDE